MLKNWMVYLRNIAYFRNTYVHMCNYLQNPRVINDERNKIASINTTKDDIISDDDSGIEEVEEWIDLKNVTRLERNNYDSQGNSLRSSYSSSLSDVNNISTFCSKEDIHSQLLLEADFYVKAFPRRAFPSYIENILSLQSER